jgi:hypothetical protein
MGFDWKSGKYVWPAEGGNNPIIGQIFPVVRAQIDL